MIPVKLVRTTDNRRINEIEAEKLILFKTDLRDLMNKHKYKICIDFQPFENTQICAEEIEPDEIIDIDMDGDDYNLIINT